MQQKNTRKNSPTSNSHEAAYYPRENTSVKMYKKQYCSINRQMDYINRTSPIGYYYYITIFFSFFLLLLLYFVFVIDTLNFTHTQSSFLFTGNSRFYLTGNARFVHLRSMSRHEMSANFYRRENFMQNHFKKMRLVSL